MQVTGSSIRRPFIAVALLAATLGLMSSTAGGASTAGSGVAPAAARGTGDATLPAEGAPPTMQVGDRWFPRDDKGRAFVLHGFNIKLHGDRLPSITVGELRDIRTNGFTVLRLATFWADLEPTEGTWDTTYIENLRRVLRDADSVGLKVVLTMHQDSYSGLVGGYGMPDWTTRTDGLVYDDATAIPCTDPANQRAWQHFWEDTDLRQYHVRAWKKMVSEFSNEPALYGYDLLNEPCGQINAGESFTQALQRVEATQVTPMLQRVTDGIRDTDSRHWIFLEGAYALTSSLGGPGALGPVHDATGRQIFAPHIYDLGMEIGSDWNPASPFVRNYYEMIVDYGRENHVPTVVFEWGPQKPALPNAADYVSQVLHGADDAVAGWNAFAWCRGLGGWCQLDSAGNPGAGMTDTVQVYPTAIAGRPMSIVGDYPAGRSDVVVDPSGAEASGATEFYFPSRRFPTGPDVAVSTVAPVGDVARRTEELHAGQWSWSFDEATGTVSVDVDSALPYQITVRPAVMAFTKTGGEPVDANHDGRIGVGDTITFTFTIENLTDHPLGAPAIDDPLIPEVTCPDGSIPAHESATCTGTYVIDADDAASGTVANEATATVADGEEPRHATARAFVEWQVPPPTTTTTAPATTSTTTLGSTTSTLPPGTTSTTPGGTGPQGQQPPNGALPRTGTDPAPLLVVASALLVLGTAAVLVGRRRRAV